MNPNRQNSCCHPPVGPGVIGRPGYRPPMPVAGGVIGGTPCCSDVVASQNNVPCCSDIRQGGIIIGSGVQGCDKENVLRELPIAMAYVPWQSYGNVYPLAQALRNGTMFRELDLEFAGRRCN